MTLATLTSLQKFIYCFFFFLRFFRMEDTKIKIEPDLVPSSNPLLFYNSAEIKNQIPEESESFKSFRVAPKESLKNVRILKPDGYNDGKNLFVVSGIVVKPSETNCVCEKSPETETAVSTEDDHHYDFIK